MASIADTYVTVLPETSKIADGIKRAFRDVDSDARAAGVRWKKEIDAGLRDTKIKVDADTGKAKAEIAEAARDRKMNIKVDVDKRGLYEGIAALEGAKFGMTGLGAAAQGTTRAVAGAGESLSTLAGPAGIAAVVGLGAAFVELAGVAAAAAQAILLVPAAIGGIGAGVGTLFVGLSGVKDAWDAIGKASKSAGDDQESKAKAVASATRSLNSAIMAERSAQQDVARARKDARQALEDLNLELRGGAIDQKQAELDARKARQDLATGMFETAVDYEQAQLRVIEADQRVAEATQRNAQLQDTANDKRAKGVDQADAVVAAEERAAQAHENTAVAQENLAEANNKVSTAAKAAADALAGLSPNAAAALLAVQGLMPAFDQLKIATQDALFAGVGQQLTDLATTYLPMVEQLLTGIASAMNQMLTGVTSQLMTPETMSAMQEFMTNVVTAFQNLAPAMAPVTKAFSELMAVGSAFLPELASSVSELATRFADFITEASKSGDLTKSLSEGLDVVKQLVQAGWYLGQAFMSLAPIAKEIMPEIVDLCRNIRDAMPAIIGLVKAWAPPLHDINNIFAAIKKTSELVHGVIDKLKVPVDGFKIAMSAAIDFLIGKVNALIDAFNRIPLLPNVPHVGAPGATVPGTPVMPTTPVPGPDQQAPPGAQAQRRGDTVAPSAYTPLTPEQLTNPALTTPAAAPASVGNLPAVDAALLATVPAGRYTQEARGDLTAGLADCSSAVEDLVNILDKRPTTGASMYTGNAAEWLTARGFMPGTMPGAFNVGFNSSHMQATLPGGTPFNWGSDSAAARRGIGGTGAYDPAFTSHYYRPVAGTPGATPTPAPSGLTPATPTTTSHGPTGAPGDPLNIVLDPNIPANQRKTSKTGTNDAASTFGQDFAGGIAEFLGFDGSLFKNPADFGLMKILGGLSKVKVRGGDDATIGATGGGGGGILDLARSFIPQPFGALVPGSPTNAPAPGQPLQAGGGLDFRMPKGPAPGPGVVDRSIHMEGSSFGYSPTQVQDQVNAVQMVQARPTLRNLPN